MTDDRVIGTCAGCEGDIFSGAGINVDAEGGRWHPECRVAEVRKRNRPTTIVGDDAPKRRGRPPKQPAEAA